MRTARGLFCLFASFAAALFFQGAAIHAQAPIALPYTISTYAGSPTGGNVAVGAGKLCNGGGTPGTGNVLPVATDSLNNGCPISQAIFSSDLRGGIAADPLGNLYIADTSSLQIRKIDARSGLITNFVGAQTLCAGAVDKPGDGCPIGQTGTFNNPRGLNVDPYGNVLIAGYGDQLAHLVCTTLSPICSSAQLGIMRVVAGCVTNSASNGTSEPGPDGVNATPSGTCSSTTGGINQPRGIAADIFGNVFVADTGNLRFRVVLGPATYNGVVNPLYAVLKTGSTFGGFSQYASPTAGNIYALFGTSTSTAFTTPASGAACSAGSAASTPNALDAYGDGCPFYNSKVSTGGGAIQAVGADANGNVFFADGNTLVRVLYLGGRAVANAIKANNPTVTLPQVGYTYVLAGGGTTNALGTTPVLGTTTALGSIYKLTVDHLGNLFLGDASGSSVDFFDMQTGYLRKVALGGTACTTGAFGTPNAIGDGCPATQALFSGGNGIGVAVNQLGDLFLADVGHAVIRKASAVSFAPTTVNTPSTPSLFVHGEPGTTAFAPTLQTSSDLMLGTPTCMTNAPGANIGSGDNSFDCVYPVTVQPAGLGLRSAALNLGETTSGTAGSLATSLSTSARGTALAFDVSSAAPSTATIGPYTAPVAGAADGAGNAFVASGGNIYESPRTSGTPIQLVSGVGNVTSLSTDAGSNVYYTVAGASAIGKLSFTPPSTFTGGTIATSATPTALVADSLGDLYFFDSTSKSILRYTAANGSVAALTTVGGSAITFQNVRSLAFDHIGNLVVADFAAGTVYRVPLNGNAPTPVAVSASVAPVGVTADEAGNVYIADSASQSVFAISSSGTQTTVATGFGALSAIALDQFGNVYVADLGAGSIPAGVTEIVRAGYSYIFPNTATNLTGALSNVGNLGSTGLYQSDSANFSLFNSGATCTSGTALLSGYACSINASFLPPSSGGGTLNGIVALNPTASTLGALLLQATVAGDAVTTTTAITGPTPSSPVYSASGTEATFTVTVTASSGTPTGFVNVSIDGGTGIAYTLSAGAGNTATASVALSGLIATSHTISATYPLTGAFNGSTTTSLTGFSIAQATTAVSWTPSANSQQYGVAIGTGIFNAVALSGSSSVPGSYVYMASTNGGPAQMVDSASYLPILPTGQSYTLAVAFTPNDAVDYAGSTLTLSTQFSVTKATTTAAVGASQMVIAQDGSGNFTSVETAVNALPATGGSLYLAPGTYTEQVLVAYPNVSIHGLGGNPQNVKLTSETGAFGGANPALGIAANPFGFNNDEGSATLVVAKATIAGTSYTPTNFFLENLSITNTFDTDTTNTNAITGSNQSCTAVSTSSNNALFNAGTLCASQALTVWITADKSVFNNVRLTSLQDTLAAYNTTGSNATSGIASTSRQYYWKNYITGDIDYVFGDAAAVFDQTTFYTTYHNGSNTGNATVFAQNKSQQTGSANDYLSGYVVNNSSFTSQNATVAGQAMTALYFGRPYGTYSTTVLINNSVDDVNALGWEPFSGSVVPGTASYFEYGTTCTTANCSTTGRETGSAQPEMVSAAAAAKFAPLTFLSSPSPDVWNPTAALATGINNYVPAGTSLTVPYGQSVTILARPLVPGGGAIPTGTYTLTDNGQSLIGSGTLTGTLDASGAAYFTTRSLAVGNHSLVFTYSGDANFSGSTSSTYQVTVAALSTTTTLAVQTASPTYGQAVSVTATVAASSGPIPTGTVALTVDGGGTPVNATLVSGVATFSLTGLTAGSHSLAAVYQASGNDATSTGTGTVSLAKAVLTVAGSSASRAFGSANPVLSYTISGFISPDTAAGSVTGAANVATTAVRNSPAGSYPVTTAAGTLGAANYSFTFANGTLTVNGGAAQSIVFLQPPNLPVGTVTPLYARALSGLPVTYTVSGNATVTGSTLTISGPGTITVTASQPGNSTFAPAISVSRSFLAK